MKKLKKKIMKELDLDRQFHDIKIIYRTPHVVFSDHIVFTPIEIKRDKHIKIMFDRLNFTPHLKAAELYISVETRIEVGGEDVQQTVLEGGGREELQSLHVNGHPTLTPCITIRGYILSCHETPNPMEVFGFSYQHKYIKSLKVEDEVDVDHGRDEYKVMIGRDDFHKYVDHYENVDNVHNNLVDDDNDHAMEFHDDNDVGNDIGVQHVTNTVSTYEAYGLSFHANTWDNIVDPSNVEIPFSSSWVQGMNFSKGLIFHNKEAVRQTLIVYSMDNNKSYITKWSN